MSAATAQDRTAVGSYFIANYPPFSAWTPEHADAARAALEAPPRPEQGTNRDLPYWFGAGLVPNRPFVLFSPTATGSHLANLD